MNANFFLSALKAEKEQASSTGKLIEETTLAYH